MNMRSTGRRVAVGLAVASTLLMSACGGGGASSGSKDFTLSISVSTPSLDISKAYAADALTALSMFTQPLEQVELDGSLRPLLAASVTEPNDKTLVYKLRPDVKFSDGTALTSDDVAWSLNYLRRPDAQTVTEFASVDTIEATGRDEVTVTSKVPDPALRGAIGLVGFIQKASAAKAHLDELGSAGAVPVGTGPYVPETFTPTELKLKRNAHYWGEKPAPDTLTFSTIEKDSQALLAMQSGEIEGTLPTDLRGLPNWSRVEGSSIYQTTSPYITFLSLNTTVAPFDDVHVRRAIAHAIDAAGVNRSVNGDAGQVNTTMTPEAVLVGTAPDESAVEDLESSVTTYEYSTAQAKSELEQSKYGLDVTIPLTYPSDKAYGKLAALNLAEGLKSIGVEVTTKAVPFNDIGADIYANKPPAAFPFQMAPSIPDASSWFKYLAAENEPLNTALWKTATTNADLADAQSTDKATRWEATKSFVAQLTTDLPYVPLFSQDDAFVLSNGWEFTGAPTFYDRTSGRWVDLLSKK